MLTKKSFDTCLYWQPNQRHQKNRALPKYSREIENTKFSQKKQIEGEAKTLKEEAVPTNMPPSPVTTATHIATIFGTVARGGVARCYGDK